jgi:hypothetical protein
MQTADPIAGRLVGRCHECGADARSYGGRPAVIYHRPDCPDHALNRPEEGRPKP